ncbi:hypothetical protein Scep_016695 [Stephania cephalantha]|uniref:Uncharacterized protein n=1 Tax=Stephania cephalantha TaxID=152367 RepID=A0AAP0INA8_9MAGN
MWRRNRPKLGAFKLEKCPTTAERDGEEQRQLRFEIASWFVDENKWALSEGRKSDKHTSQSRPSMVVRGLGEGEGGEGGEDGGVEAAKGAVAVELEDRSAKKMIRGRQQEWWWRWERKHRA